VRLGQEVQALPRPPDLSEPRAIRVVAGVVCDAAGRVLVNQRRPGQHMAGRWEFPGGKLAAGEDERAGLARELREELGIEVESARPLIEIRHRYADRDVVLHVWRVLRHAGVPHGLEGQPLRWLAPDALATVDLLEADRPIVVALALPDCYLVTGEPARDPRRFLGLLDAALARGVRLVQLRAPGLDAASHAKLAHAASAACRAQGAALLLNGEPCAMAPLALEVGASGIHVPARHVERLAGWTPPAGLHVGASCHDAAELRAARDAGAHFAVLGPVRATPSHPAAVPLGWERFAALARGAGLPVYALGGVAPADLATAWDAGGQGIAAVRALWNPDAQTPG
jgi:8-oxo-dGTP diphosphatase